VQGETLASELDFSGALDAAAFQVEAELGGAKVRIALAKASV
jgi:hypothetical protein